MSDSTIYQYARVSATIGAGIFTGLTLSAPLYALPATSAFSLFHTVQQKQYSTERQKLSPSDRLTLFKTIHHTTGAVAIPVAVISGALYGVAAYFTPVSLVLCLQLLLAYGVLSSPAVQLEASSCVQRALPGPWCWRNWIPLCLRLCKRIIPLLMVPILNHLIAAAYPHHRSSRSPHRLLHRAVLHPSHLIPHLRSRRT